MNRESKIAFAVFLAGVAVLIGAFALKAVMPQQSAVPLDIGISHWDWVLAIIFILGLVVLVQSKIINLRGSASALALLSLLVVVISLFVPDEFIPTNANWISARGALHVIGMMLFLVAVVLGLTDETESEVRKNGKEKNE